MRIRLWTGLVMLVGGGALTAIGGKLMKPTLEACKDVLVDDLNEKKQKLEQPKKEESE